MRRWVSRGLIPEPRSEGNYTWSRRTHRGDNRWREHQWTQSKDSLGVGNMEVRDKLEMEIEHQLEECPQGIQEALRLQKVVETMGCF